jgi:PAS domain S-box-containing protein
MIRSGSTLEAYARYPTSTKTLEIILIATSAAIILSLVGAWTWMASTARRDQLDATRVKVENLAATMATHAEQSIRAADIVLLDIVERAEHDGLGAVNSARLGQHLKQQASTVDSFATFGIIDADGHVRISSTIAASPLEVSDRDYFQFHRANPDEGLHIDKPITGRRAGTHIFPVTRAIKTADGRFDGVAFGSMWTEAFQKFYETLDTGHLGVMRLALEDGTVLIRKPYVAENVGRNIISGNVQAYLPERDAGALRTVSPVDGVVRWTSIRTVPELHMVVAASLSETEELASWHRETVRQGFAVSVMVLFILGLTVFLIRDIRYRHRMQLLREDTVAHIRAITDHQPALISYVDTDGKIRFINKTGERWYGKPATDIVGMDVSQEPPLDKEENRSSREPVHFDQVRYDSDGNKRIVEGILVPDQQPDGQSRGYYIFATDVTERSLAEEKLRQAQKMDAIGQLTGGIAHDFNNRLTVILGNTELLVDELAANETLRPIAEMTMRAADRGAELTARLLAFSRRQPLDPKATDINKLISGMDGLLRRTLAEHIEIEMVRGGGLWEALIDAPQLESAILNLCINARDAMSDGGRLTIETANVRLDETYAARHAEVASGQYVMIAVSDTGTGMDAPTVARAFEPFFTTKAVGKGSGLGLSMVYGFVKQSKGHVKIYSEPGQGTTIKLYLPRADSDVDRLEPQAAAKPSAPVGSEKILVVEDDDLVREQVSTQLRSLHYQVVSVENGRQALDLLQKTSDFDLLFTDIVMPGGINGRELAEAARKINPDLRVLFTSGYTENAIVHHGRLDRGVHLLNKPYRRQDLAVKIRNVLDGESK